MNNKDILIKVKFDGENERICTIHCSSFKYFKEYFIKDCCFFQVLPESEYRAFIMLYKNYLLEEYKNLSISELLKKIRKHQVNIIHKNREIKESFNKRDKVLLLIDSNTGSLKTYMLDFYKFDKYKRFILYIMKNYNINSKIAYNAYKKGITDGIVNINTDLFSDLYNGFFIRIYGESGIEKAMKFFVKIYDDFEKYNGEIHA